MKLSIIIPCYNESSYITRCLDSLLSNDFPLEELEILIIDGGSTDGTLDIINNYIIRYDFIKLIHNERKLKPIALNIGIESAVGDVIMRIDAHATYDKNYISVLVNGLYSENVDNIGGVRDTYIPVEGTDMEITLSEAISHPLIVGNAYYRTGVLLEKKLVDTVFCGCYRKEVFKKIGGFNERLIRTQDRELNARLLESGGKILLVPNVHCTYYPRTEFTEYLKWNWKGAEWLGYAQRFTDCKMFSLRNFVPVFFSLYVTLLLLLWGYSVYANFNYSLLMVSSIPLLVYFFLALQAGTRLYIRYKRTGLLFLFPFITFLTHMSYGYALLWGIFQAKILRKSNK